MSRIVIRFLSVLLVMLLLLLGLVLFVFSDAGNTFLTPYIQARLEKATGMPVAIKQFKLKPGKVTLAARLNRQLQFRAVSNYNLVKRSFSGAYMIAAKHFTYEAVTLSDISIDGKFRGIADTIRLNGKGHALHAPLAYKVYVKKGELKNIEAIVNGLPVAKLLALAKQPPLITGKADLTIHMPHIGQKGAKGTAQLRLKDAYLQKALIKKYYGYTLPAKSRVSLNADAKLDGVSLLFDAHADSNLLHFSLTEGQYDTQTKVLHSKYTMAVNEMRVITDNKLAGAFNAAGTIIAKDKVFQIRGTSHSLGGTLSFDAGKQVHLKMQSLSVGKLLKLIRQPALLEGKLDGTIDLDDTSLQSGDYVIDVTRGRINAKKVQRLWKRKLPSHNRFSLHSEGRVQKGVVLSSASLHSTIADLMLKSLRYETASRKLSTRYDLQVKDMTLLGVKSHYPLEAEGKLGYDRQLSVDGAIKGLGEHVVFHYAGIKADVDAAGLYIQRLLALAGYPEALQGKLNLKADITNLTTLEGSLHLKGKNLSTQPRAMQKLTGKALKMHIGLLQFDVNMKSGDTTGEGVLQSSLGTLHLQHVRIAPKQQNMSLDYDLKIPSLLAFEPLLGRKLYGTMHLQGKAMQQHGVLNATGETSSLGGKIAFVLKRNRFTMHLSSVPLEKLLQVLGYPPHFLGTAGGKAVYDTVSKKGKADLTLKNFQIKPSQLTEVLAAVLGKDPSRIVFQKTHYHADINGDQVRYTLQAKGMRSGISITQGYINTRTKAQSGRVKFLYEGKVLYGKISGSIDKPKFILDAGSTIKAQYGKKLEEKVEKKWGKEAGALLKNFGL